MQVPRPLDEMSGSELLGHVDALATTQRECEVEILRAAVQHAILHNPDTLDPNVTRLNGRERARRFGGNGTPEVAEFAPAELAGRLQVSSYAARDLMADALDLVHRFPQTWRRVEALEVRASYARFVARKCRDLTLEQAMYVDGRVVQSADGRLTWSRFERLVEAAIVAADTEAARRREEEAAAQQMARATRATEHGMRGFYVRGPVEEIARLDATVTYVAEVLGRLGDPDDVDRRRVKALVILANPARACALLAAFARWKDRPADAPPPPAHVDEPPVTAGDGGGDKPEVDWSVLLPVVQLFVHVYAGMDGTGTVRVEGPGGGLGPMTEEWLRERLGPRARFTVREVLDIEGQAPVDAYEIPDRHRQAVHLMTPADTFPFSSNTTRSQHLDHTVPFVHGEAAKGAGQSRLGNYGPMTGFHHRVKTHGKWQVKQPFPGIYLWCDPHGALYLVDHTGTRRIWRGPSIDLVYAA
jgi:hypothetical protein